MKKILALMLAALTAVACLSGCKKDPGPSSSPINSSSAGGGMIDGDKFTDRNELSFEYSVGVGGKLTYDTTPLENTNAPKAGASYTYNLAVSDLPTSWNIHTYQSNSATYVLDYTTDGLFTFDYNTDKDGYRIVPSMAKDYPDDVTAEFVGSWGIEEGDANRVYKVLLKDNLKFDNNDPITAKTFVESYKLLLNPEAANYRADTFFSGNLVIANSKRYVFQGKTVNVDSTEIYKTWDDADKSKIVFDLTDSYIGVNFLTENYADYVETSGAAWLLHSGFGLGFDDDDTELFTQAELESMIGKTYSEIEADTKMSSIWSILIDWWKTEPNEELHFFCKPETYEANYGFENVGFFADDDANALYIVNEKELSGFYLLYSLSTDFFLVHPQTYKNCETNSQGVYNNSYGTSVEKYVGFGPYRLVTYIADSKISFEKNQFWHGYADEANKNNYWTTNINMSKVEQTETRLQMFLQGKTDSYGLSASDMDDYQSSPYTYFTEGDSTWFVALNPDLDGLKAAQDVAQTTAGNGVEINKTILTIKEFRQALSFSIDRAAYELALDPLGSVAKSLYGNMIVSDPEKGTAYRTTEEAKDAILKFWGLYDLVGTVYETKDEAIASITGYDLSGAKALFNTAYEKAVAQGLISAEAAASGNFKVQIIIGKPSEHEYYNNGYEFLKNTWTDAAKGTALEGKLEFIQSQTLGSNEFSDYLKNNTVDVLFGVGWTGSALDPYGLMEVYVSPNYQYDTGWDASKTSLDITLTDINNVTYTLRASVYDWGYTALGGEKIKAYVVGNDGKLSGDYVYVSAGVSAASSIRLAVLAAVETAVLEQYDMIPVGTEASATMKGMKIKYGTEEYVYGVGRGGVKYMTYNYTDTEWTEFVDAQGGTLNYK